MNERERAGPMAVATITLGLLTWPIAFNLGAHDVIFYDDIFRVVVASSILSVVALWFRPYPPKRLALVFVALIAPLGWFVTAGYVVGSTSEAIERPGFAAWLIAIAIVSVPLTLRLLLDWFLPDLAAAADRRTIVAVVALIAVVGIAGYTAGAHNDRFMTCEDFEIAGSSSPTNCAQ